MALPIVVVEVKINGSVDTLPPGSLVDFRASQTIDGPSRLQLAWEDPDFALMDSAPKVGGECEASLVIGDVATSVFKGVISSVGVAHDLAAVDGGHVGRFLLEAEDDSRRLYTATTLGTHLKKSVKDVVSAIASAHQFTPEVGSDFVSARNDYVLQHETDGAMLDRLAVLYSCEWFVMDGKLHFRAPPATADSTATVSYMDDLFAFSASYSAATAVKKVTVNDWDRPTEGPAKATTTATAKLDIQSIGTDASAIAAQAKAASTGEVVVPVVTDTPADRTLVSDGLARAQQQRGLQAHGLCDPAPGVRAGSHITIQGVGNLSGDYYVREVIHELRRDGTAHTEFRCGEAPEPAPRPQTPAGDHASQWGQRGPVIGVVTAVKPEGIQVKFPALADQQAREARVVSPGAGPERGVDFVPEVNDEVLVAFENGDTRAPVILGGLWNKKNAAPTDRDGKVRSIRSREGHELSFDDDQKIIKLVTADGEHVVTMTDGQKIEVAVPAGSELVLKAGGTSITLSDSDGVTVKTNGDVDVKGNNVNLTAQANFKAKASANANVEAGANGVFKAGAMGTVQAGAPLTVKGAIVNINS